MIELRNSINSEEIPENENPKKVVNIFEKIIDFNKSQKGKELKILTPKPILQRLSTALAQSDKSYILCIKKQKLLKSI